MSSKDQGCGSSQSSGEEDHDYAMQITCDALCSLSSAASHHNAASCAGQMLPPDNSYGEYDATLDDKTCKQQANRGNLKTCPKQLQLPMFLSKTYHMIDRCDPEIAAWSDAGDNFVVKNVEKFATTVLPLYFKHSNFSSFARQLNFYGFRKLRTDPILTNDVDPRTSCHVRFFHEYFQKDKPHLLHQIRRATKTDQQAKDEFDILRQEIQRLRESNMKMKEDFERRLTDITYEVNRRVTSLTSDYDKLVSLVQPILQQSLRNEAAVASLRDFPSSGVARTQMTPDLLHSLNAAALSQQLLAANPSVAAQAAFLNEAVAAAASSSSGKRPREDGTNLSSSSRVRFD